MSNLPNNFLGLPKRYNDYDRARFAVLPIPYDSTTSFQTGTREGPAAIIRASQQAELFDEELEGEVSVRPTTSSIRLPGSRRCLRVEGGICNAGIETR